MRKQIIIASGILLLALGLFAFLHTPFGSKKILRTIESTSSASSTIPLKKLQAKGRSAASYAKHKGFNTQFCFLVDMTTASGEKRFFVYDLKRDTVLHSGLVTHGRCNEAWLEGRRYSNKVGSGCTSLGKYRVGKAYKGRFGLAYKLHGLEPSNSNAYARYVVLHAHECVPTESVDEICQSDGCPTVAPSFLKALAPMIDRSAKPVLLWIFE